MATGPEWHFPDEDVPVQNVPPSQEILTYPYTTAPIPELTTVTIPDGTIAPIPESTTSSVPRYTTTPISQTREHKPRIWRRRWVRRRRVRRLKRRIVYKFGQTRIRGVGAGTGQVPNAVTAPAPSESARREIAASAAQLKYAVRETAHRAVVAGTERESRNVPPLYPGTTRRAIYQMASRPVSNSRRLWRRFWHQPVVY